MNGVFQSLKAQHWKKAAGYKSGKMSNSSQNVMVK